MLPRYSYIRTGNGNAAYHPYHQATVHSEDRGYQFADGVYEVIAAINGQLLDGDAHLLRLQRSLSELDIPRPMSLEAMKLVIHELIRRHPRNDGHIYIQITRGQTPRAHIAPAGPLEPTLVITFHQIPRPSDQAYAQGVKVVTAPDIRWARCDIKSIALLPNTLSKSYAKRQSAAEVWMIDEHNQVITEGGSSNSFLVDASGTLRTHPATNSILNGITRLVVLQLARELDIPVNETAFTLSDIASAQEAFATSTGIGVLPVTTVDNRTIGDGNIGKTTRKLMESFNHYCTTSCPR